MKLLRANDTSAWRLVKEIQPEFAHFSDAAFVDEMSPRFNVPTLIFLLARTVELHSSLALDDVTGAESMEHDVRRNLVAGCDEAGRGPLAGPVVCAAVILPPRMRTNGITDCKLLSEGQREELYDYIRGQAVDYALVAVDHTIIDEINILQASLLGMRLAVEQLKHAPEFVLVDGKQMIPNLAIPQIALVKGDRLSLSIAAASILAKVTRDRLMCSLHRRFPQYGFAEHKGYPTPEHRAALLKHGLSSIHRRSFRCLPEETEVQETLALE